MNWKINGRDYTGFSDFDWLLLQVNRDDWLDWFEMRIMSLSICPIKCLFANDHQWIGGTQMFALLACLQLIMETIEGLGRICSPGENADYQKACQLFFKCWMPSDWMDREFVEWAYIYARNGLSHQGTISKGGLDDKIDTFLKHSANKYSVNPYTLFEAFQKGFKNMSQAIREDQSERGIRSVFQRNFENRFKR